MSFKAFSPYTSKPTAPPVSSLDSPKHTSPMMLLSGSRRGQLAARSDCLALMWPSENDDETCSSHSSVSPFMKTHLGGTLMASTHKHDSMKISSPHGEGSMSMDRTAEVLVCPSGQTVVRVKASVEAVLPSQNSRSPSTIKQLALPYYPSSTLRDKSHYGSPGFDSSSWQLRGGSSTLSFPGRSLLFDTNDERHKSQFPSPAQSPSATRSMSSGGDTPSAPPSSSAKKKGPRRRKISGKDKGDKTRFVGGAQGILEQDHPEEDVSSHSRCPCFKFFLLVCLIALFLAVLFYLSLWLVAQHRGSPIIVAGGESLQSILQKYVFGQPIVTYLLPQLLSGILAKDSTDRTMVLMFHGQSGVGKTFVADLIGRNLFSDHTRSQCVRKFLPSFVEVKEHLVSPYDYSIALEDFIDQGKANYRTCSVGFYFIEDLDYDTSASLLEAIAFTLPGIRKRQGAQEQRMVFILMTNFQSKAIGQYLRAQLKNGRTRDDVTLRELEPIMTAIPSVSESLDNDASSTDGVQGKSDLLSIHEKLLSVADHHIPFFPLEREHVILCIQRTMSVKNVTLADNDIQWIADKLSYYPENDPIFSLSGCKKVEEKANLFSKYAKT